MAVPSLFISLTRTNLWVDNEHGLKGPGVRSLRDRDEGFKRYRSTVGDRTGEEGWYGSGVLVGMGIFSPDLKMSGAGCFDWVLR